MTDNSATEAAAGKADIVERLRHGPLFDADIDDDRNIIEEAATEIASLRERVKELEGVSEKYYKWWCEQRDRAETAERKLADLEGHFATLAAMAKESETLRCKALDVAELAEQRVKELEWGLKCSEKIVRHWQARAETAERELEAMNLNHRAMATQLADTGRKLAKAISALQWIGENDLLLAFESWKKPPWMVLRRDGYEGYSLVIAEGDTAIAAIEAARAITEEK